MTGKRWLLFGVLVCASVFFLHHFAQLEKLLATLWSGRPTWIALAILLQVASLLNQPALYQSLYTMLRLPARWRELLPIVWAGHFVNVVTPAAGLGSTALLLADARRRGWDVGRATLANTLYFLLNFLWYAMLLAASLILLWIRHDLKPYEIIASSIVMVGVAVAFLMLWLVSVRPASFGQLLSNIAGFFNKVSRYFLHRAVLSNDGMSKFAHEFALAAGTLKSARGQLARPWLHTMLVDGLEIAVLAACFGAFPDKNASATLSPTLILVGYSIGTLFLIVSVTPQGLGVVEGVMTAIFVSFGVPIERAAIVVLAYRGLSFWLPLIAGFVVLHQMPQLKERQGSSIEGNSVV